jgi:hypothetical protein
MYNFSGADCDSDQNMVVLEAGERLFVSKQTNQNFDIQRFNLKKVNDVEVNKQYLG